MGLFDWLKGKKPQENEISFELTTKTEVIDYGDENENNTVSGYMGPFSAVNIDGYKSPSGGYMDYAIFQVSGIIEETGRHTTRKIEATTAESAIEIAKEGGLLEPEIKCVVPHQPPTERQIKDTKGWNIPKDVCMLDIATIQKRQEYYDETDVPREDFALFAHKMEVHFSRFITESSLLRHVIRDLKKRDKAAFFAYCQLCRRDGAEFGNMLESPYLQHLYGFADMVMSSKSLLKSLDDRWYNDFTTPHKGTAIYKAVAEYFNL